MEKLYYRKTKPLGKLPKDWEFIADALGLFGAYGMIYFLAYIFA